jgi:Flp pilus assembly pilin Flp
MAKSLEVAKILWLGEDAATMVEYALMIGFVAMLCVTGITALGVSLKGPFQSAINGLS